MAARCDCGCPRNHGVHIKALNLPGYHQWRDPSRAGLDPIGAGRRRFNESPEGRAYNAVTASLRSGEVACQVQSPVCTGIAQHQDEALPRGRAGGIAAALRDGPEPTLCCDPCNAWLPQNLVWAAENGFARFKPPVTSKDSK